MQLELVGIITLEDVIEELIGEEIVDETDQYVDVHRRIAVARARLANVRHTASAPAHLVDKGEASDSKEHSGPSKKAKLRKSRSVSQPEIVQSVESLQVSVIALQGSVQQGTDLPLLRNQVLGHRVIRTPNCLLALDLIVTYTFPVKVTLVGKKLTTIAMYFRRVL